MMEHSLTDCRRSFYVRIRIRFKKLGITFEVWFRYVDDTYAVVQKRMSKTHLKSCTTLYNESINFKFYFWTLPFSYLKTKRLDKKFEFSICWMPTTIARCITNDSYWTYQLKTAAFHATIYLLCKLPLSFLDYKNESEKNF